MEQFAIPSVPDDSPVCSWGRAYELFGRRIFADGSGLANSSPELRRCGWAAVEWGPSGLPVRAVYGPSLGGFSRFPGPSATRSIKR
eukprot:7377931-Pyramimonas_sp.AAC.1